MVWWAQSRAWGPLVSPWHLGMQSLLRCTKPCSRREGWKAAQPEPLSTALSAQQKGMLPPSTAQRDLFVSPRSRATTEAERASSISVFPATTSASDVRQDQYLLDKCWSNRTSWPESESRQCWGTWSQGSEFEVGVLTPHLPTSPSTYMALAHTVGRRYLPVASTCNDPQ